MSVAYADITGYYKDYWDVKIYETSKNARDVYCNLSTGLKLYLVN